MKCPNCDQQDEVIKTKHNGYECERCKIEFWFEDEEHKHTEDGE